MMKTLLVILFIFSASLSGALVLVPDSCISKNKSPCLVKTQSKPELVRWGKTLIWLAKDSMLELKTDNLRALQGSVWIQSSEEVPFSTSYIQGTVSGDLWLTHASDKTMVRHLSGELFLRHSSSTEAVTLPVGFENWYSGLQTDGKPYQGTLKPLPANSFLVEWFKEFKMPVALAKKIWQTWALSWKGNIEVGSEIYQASMERHLASEKLKEQAWANRQEQQHQEAARLRALYRSKNGMDAFHSPTQSPDSRDF